MSFSEGDFSQIIFHRHNQFPDHKHKTIHSYILKSNIAKSLATFGKQI